MPRFTRFNRKAALLLAKLRELGYTDGNKEVPALGGRKLNTVRYWRYRGTDADYRASASVSRCLREHSVISDTRDVLSDTVTDHEFAETLGYTLPAARRIIDEAYAELFPTYSIFYSPERAAADVFERFEGISFIYRLETGEKITEYTRCSTSVLQMPLVVRYTMKGTRPTVIEFYRVRCKLTIPSYTSAISFFEYDGYITPQKHGTHYWFFENRSEENKDLLLMMTEEMKIARRHDEEGRLQNVSFTEGIMITRRQDDWSTHKVWKIVIVKQPSAPPADDADPEAPLSRDCRVTTLEDTPSWIVASLRLGWGFLDLSAFPPRP